MEFLTSDFALFMLIGFAAQIIDGALGMAFGVLATSSLLAMGVPPAMASAMTHVTECFTTAASGVSHAWHRNVDWKLVRRLAPAGMIGGAAGAYLLSNIDGSVIAPFISIYLVGIGFFILYKALRPIKQRKMHDRAVPFIGSVGGFLDAIGGGGWGPMVTSTLLGRGHDVKKAIGSTNLTEFMVTLVISTTFVLSLGWGELSSAAGLIVGGVLAAPLGAFVLAKVPVKPLMIAVAIVIISTALLRLI